MTLQPVQVSPSAQAALLELASRTGRPPADVLDAAVEAYRRQLGGLPVAAVPGVDPADVWEAAAQADAGRLAPHGEVFARLRGRP